jgi:hypothetical protein
MKPLTPEERNNLAWAKDALDEIEYGPGLSDETVHSKLKLAIHFLEKIQEKYKPKGEI